MWRLNIHVKDEILTNKPKISRMVSNIDKKFREVLFYNWQYQRSRTKLRYKSDQEKLYTEVSFYNSQYQRSKTKLRYKSDQGKVYEGNNIIEVYNLILNGYNLDNQDSGGFTSLMLTSESGKKDIVKLLLENDTSIDLQSRSGGTALIDASLKGYKDIFKMLLVNDINIDIKTNSGMTALIFASMRDKIHSSFKSSLINEEQYVRTHVDIVKLLLENNANIDLQNIKGYTSFISASKQNKKDIVDLLLKNNASIDIQNNDGDTALMLRTDFIPKE